jgi:ketosteroid isomerase-like protein
MSQENVELMRQAFAAFNRGDLDAVVANFSATFEYRPTGGLPDAEDVYRGPEEFKRFLGWLSDEFDEPRMEADDFIDVDDFVVVSMTNRGRGKLSGVETSWHVWLVWTVRGGIAVRGEAFTSQAEALKAAGLSREPGVSDRAET